LVLQENLLFRQGRYGGVLLHGSKESVKFLIFLGSGHGVHAGEGSHPLFLTPVLESPGGPAVVKGAKKILRGAARQEGPHILIMKKQGQTLPAPLVEVLQ
jgi:hypothetical protein